MGETMSDRLDRKAKNDSRDETSPYHGELDFTHSFRMDTDLDGNRDVWCEVTVADTSAICTVDIETGEALNGLFVDGTRGFAVH